MSSRAPVCLAVIPARGGSKGVIDKNIRPFAGKSLLQIAIECAGGAKMISETIVSTDSERIAEVARGAGGKVPFLRPSELSGDEVPIWEVSAHAGEWFAKTRGAPPDMVMALQPTSPLRRPDHLDAAICLLADSDADAVMTVTEAEHTPFKMRVIDDGQLRDFMPGRTVGQRQDAMPVYRLNGVAYVTRWEALLATRSLWGHKTLPLVLPDDVASNIDTMLDFEIAEFLYQRAAGAQPRH
jgi:N-acylneuraminate cytidylyltransferase/CMP-N,N'-diacetyllegionaminic acid synthase